MNADTGEIREMTPEEQKEAMRQEEAAFRRKAELGNPRNERRVDASPWIPLTDREAAFFKTKGVAFRQLWGKRMHRGLCQDERQRLDAMIAAWEAA